MKTGFNGAGGIDGSSLRWRRRLRQGGGEVKMAFDVSGGGGNGREGGSSVGIAVGHWRRHQRWRRQQRQGRPSSVTTAMTAVVATAAAAAVAAASTVAAAAVLMAVALTMMSVTTAAAAVAVMVVAEAQRQ